MGDRQVGDRPTEVGTSAGIMSVRELVTHGAAVLLGPLVAVVLVGVATPALVWRTAALPLALTLVVAGLRRLVRIGRAEWRREAPSMPEYLGAGLRFLAAFVLAALAVA